MTKNILDEANIKLYEGIVPEKVAKVREKVGIESKGRENKGKGNL